MISLIALAGSPRRGGNSDRLLNAFVRGARDAGAEIEHVTMTDLRISPCDGCARCEREGRCVIDDDHPALADRIRDCDVFALASPVYFCGFPGSTKNFVDRFQGLWARRYRLGDPPRSGPAGYLLATGGAPSLKNFDGMTSTFKYLMRAVWGESAGAVLVPDMDRAGDLTDEHEAVQRARQLGFSSVQRTHTQEGS